MITELRKTRDTTKEWDVKDLESDWFILSHSHSEDILGMYNVTLIYTILTNNKTLYCDQTVCTYLCYTDVLYDKVRDKECHCGNIT